MSFVDSLLDEPRDVGLHWRRTIREEVRQIMQERDELRARAEGYREGIERLIAHHGHDSDGTTSGWWRKELAQLLEAAKTGVIGPHGRPPWPIIIGTEDLTSLLGRNPEVGEVATVPLAEFDRRYLNGRYRIVRTDPDGEWMGFGWELTRLRD